MPLWFGWRSHQATVLGVPVRGVLAVLVGAPPVVIVALAQVRIYVPIWIAIHIGLHVAVPRVVDPIRAGPLPDALTRVPIPTVPLIDVIIAPIRFRGFAEPV